MLDSWWCARESLRTCHGYCRYPQSLWRVCAEESRGRNQGWVHCLTFPFPGFHLDSHEFVWGIGAAPRWGNKKKHRFEINVRLRSEMGIQPVPLRTNDI